MSRILVVEDDTGARRVATMSLQREGHVVLEAADTTRARILLADEAVDLVVLDLGLPDGSGIDLITQVRTGSDAGVVIVTGRGELEDRIVGLRLGADDYLVKPVAPVELSARVEAVLRRRRPSETRTIVEFDDVRIDRSAREVTAAGEPVELTPIEFDLLAFLAVHPRKAFSRDELLTRVWRSSPEFQVRSTVTEHVRKLRRKLSDATGRTWITTVRGVGYRLDP